MQQYLNLQEVQYFGRKGFAFLNKKMQRMKKFGEVGSIGDVGCYSGKKKTLKKSGK